MSSIKVGVIGAGAIAPSHCRGVIKHGKGELLAIADTHAGRAEAIKDEYRIPRMYTNVQEIISDKDIDAVTIALPTFLHSQVALAALEAGKHVLLDKPFAMNVAEAEEVIRASQKNGHVFAVGMNQRFNESSQTIKALKERGELGDLYHGEAYWCRRSGAPKFGTWFGDKSKSGGGALLDIGVHALDLCLHLLGNFEPEAVTGSAYTKFGNRGLGEGGWGKSDRGEVIFDVDDFTAAFIKLSGGVSVILKASWARHQTEANMTNVEIFGTEGGATVNPPRICRYAADPKEYEVVDIQGVPLRHPACDRLVNWLDAIAGDDELECKPQQSLAVQQIIDGIYESSKTGREVRI